MLSGEGTAKNNTNNTNGHNGCYVFVNAMVSVQMWPQPLTYTPLYVFIIADMLQRFDH